MIENEVKDSRRLLEARYRFYKAEANCGNYHNPYDFRDEMEALLDNVYSPNTEIYDFWEDRIYSRAM